MTNDVKNDIVILNCVKLCDTEIDRLIMTGQFVTHSQRVRYLYGNNYYDRSQPRKFTRKFIKAFFQLSRHKSLLETIYLGG